MKVLGPLTTMAILAVPSTALAWAPEDPTKAFTLTVSPIHLIMETGEFTGEFALAKKHGLAAIAGIGVPNGQEIIELGASYRYYVLGNFDRGMQVGGELLLAGEIDAEFDEMVGMPSAFIGGKFTTGVGFTIDGQLGVGIIEEEIAPLLNLNLGWSFGNKE
jgi:hypothetical protein